MYRRFCICVFDSRSYNVSYYDVSINCRWTKKSILFPESGPFTIYKATDRDLNVLCGDVFNLDTSYAGPFDVIWDCNAIVAINADDRERYVKAELSVLKEGGRILMTTWVYEQSIHIRFPLCVSPEMVEKLFAAQCDVRVVENIVLPNDSHFCQRHELPWAIRPVLFLNRKELVQWPSYANSVSKYNNYIIVHKH